MVAGDHPVPFLVSGEDEGPVGLELTACLASVAIGLECHTPLGDRLPLVGDLSLHGDQAGLGRTSGNSATPEGNEENGGQTNTIDLRAIFDIDGHLQRVAGGGKAPGESDQRIAASHHPASSIRVRTDHFAAGNRAKAVPGDRIDRILDEVDAAVAEQGVDAAGVVAAGV